MRQFVVAMCALVLAGCGAGSGLADLKAVTLADAQLALKWAQEDNDVLAAPCYAAVVDILTTSSLPNLQREPNGVLSGIYLARSIRKDVESVGQSEIRQKFLLGCAPLVADQRDVMLKLGVRILPFAP